VNTYLVVPQGRADVMADFLKAAFGGREVMVMRDPDGRLAHGEWKVGDSVIEMGEGNGEWFTKASLHYFVPDVDATHILALNAGAKEIGSPVDHEYGERSSTIEDPCGNRWYIAKVISASR